MTAIDGTGVQALEEVIGRAQESGREVVLCGMREQPERILAKAGIEKLVGAGNVCVNVSSAMSRARVILATKKI